MSEANLAMDVGGLLNAVGAWQASAKALMNSPARKKLIKVLEKFSSEKWAVMIDKQALAGINLQHMYLWGQQGNPQARLFRMHWSNAGTKTSGAIVYLPDTSQVPLEPEFDSILQNQKKYQSRHIIIDKARRFEERASEVGVPGTRDPLVERIDGAAENNPTYVSYVPRGGNEQVFFRKYRNNYAADPMNGDIYWNNPTIPGRIYDTLEVSYGTFGKMAFATAMSVAEFNLKHIEGDLAPETSKIWARTTAKSMSKASQMMKPAKAKPNQPAQFMVYDNGAPLMSVSQARLNYGVGNPRSRVRKAVYAKWGSLK